MAKANAIDKSMQNRTFEAVKVYLTRRGYEVIDTVDDFITCSNDSDEIVFVHVAVSSGEEFDDKCGRAEFEKFAFDWFANHSSTTGVHIRFDRISVIVLGGERALLRHHIDCMSRPE